MVFTVCESEYFFHGSGQGPGTTGGGSLAGVADREPVLIKVTVVAPSLYIL